jgi:hypothetical protein
MENRTALRGAGTPKGLVVAFAVIVAIGLAIMAAFVVKTISGPAAATVNSAQYADDKASTGHGQLP